MSTDRVSVVVPMYRTARHLPELVRRLDAVVPGAEVVLVDDACPEHSADVAQGLDPHSLTLVITRLSENVGQHAAVHVGLARVTGDVIAVMDADLQDPPEALPDLIDRLQRSPEVGAVCAARSGQYTSTGRRCTALVYRWTAWALSRGRIPRGAGMFLVARREAIDAVCALDDPVAPLVPSLAAARVTLRTVTVRRAARDDGSSAHRGVDRVRIARRGLVVLTPLGPVLARRHRADMARRNLVVDTDRPLHPGAPRG